jgi:aflatoxin B1 aldehyde reductase
VEEVVTVAQENNLILPTVYQGHYSAVSRKLENDLFPILRKYNMAFYAYSPQAGGFLAKTKAQLVDSSIEGRWDASSSAGQLFRSLYSRKALLEALDIWGQISAEADIPRAELAYRWIMFHSLLGPGDAIIFSASSQQQFELTLTGISRGPLPLSVAERVEKVWELVKEETPLDHFNREL